MRNRTRFVPAGKDLIKFSIFHWAAYTLSVVIFTIFASLLTLIGVSPLWAFNIAFSVSVVSLLGIHTNWLFRKKKEYESNKRRNSKSSTNNQIEANLESSTLTVELRETLIRTLEQQHRSFQAEVSSQLTKYTIQIRQQLHSEINQQIDRAIEQFRSQIRIELKGESQNQLSSSQPQKLESLIEKLRDELTQKSGRPVSDAELGRACLDQAMIFYNQNYYSMAVELLDQAIRLNPNNVEAYNLRGVVYYNQDKYEQAIADYSQVIQLNPKFREAYYNRGNTYKDKLGDYIKAIEDYTRIIELYPQEADAYRLRAVAYTKLEMHDEAINDYSATFKLNPEHLSRRDVSVPQKDLKPLNEIVTSVSESLEAEKKEDE